MENNEKNKRFKNWRYPKFDKNGMTKWNWRCQHPKNLLLGNGSDVGSFTYINAQFGVDIGSDSQVGSHCSIYSESTIDDKKGKVTIGNNVKIGTHSTIMPGVNIGDNSIIGAHSFVNKDIPSDVVAYGIPVRIVKKIK